MPKTVDMWCPYCRNLVRDKPHWDERAIVPTEDENHIQYAHKECAEDHSDAE